MESAVRITHYSSESYLFVLILKPGNGGLSLGKQLILVHKYERRQEDRLLRKITETSYPENT